MHASGTTTPRGCRRRGQGFQKRGIARSRRTTTTTTTTTMTTRTTTREGHLRLNFKFSPLDGRFSGGEAQEERRRKEGGHLRDGLSSPKHERDEGVKLARMRSAFWITASVDGWNEKGEGNGRATRVKLARERDLPPREGSPSRSTLPLFPCFSDSFPLSSINSLLRPAPTNSLLRSTIRRRLYIPTILFLSSGVERAAIDR